MCGGSDRFAVLEKRLNDVHEEESYSMRAEKRQGDVHEEESFSMRVMWTAAGEVHSLGLAFHLSKQRHHFSSHTVRYMYRDETVGQSWSTTYTYGWVGHSRKQPSPGKFTDVK